MKEIPTGVKVIAILGYIGSGIGVLFGLFFVLLGILAQFMNLGSFMTKEMLPVFLAPLFMALGFAMIFGGIMILVFSVVGFFIARGLWKGKNWARIVTIICSCFGVLSALIGITQGGFIHIFFLLLHGLIIWYLGFAQEVKKVFH